MSERERDVDVPPEVRAGVWANDIDVFGDVEEATLDFVRVEPRDPTDQAILRRWREAARKRAYEKLRECDAR